MFNMFLNVMKYSEMLNTHYLLFTEGGITSHPPENISNITSVCFNIVQVFWSKLCRPSLPKAPNRHLCVLVNPSVSRDSNAQNAKTTGKLIGLIFDSPVACGRHSLTASRKESSC